MTPDRKPGDDQGGLETSSELRHGDTFPPDLGPAPSAPPEKGLVGGWRVWVIVLVVVVIVSVVIYVVVNVL